jgi:hypothetical protein
MTDEIKKIKKGRGGKRLGAGRKPTAIEAANQRARFERPEQAETYKAIETPLDYMLAVMRDPMADFKRRDDMARAAAPYCHARFASKEIGKKGQAEAEAETAGLDSDWGDDLLSPSKAN